MVGCKHNIEKDIYYPEEISFAEMLLLKCFHGCEDLWVEIISQDPREINTKKSYHTFKEGVI